jgi:T5SS/PEP-CTERM-associated repeat protein
VLQANPHLTTTQLTDVLQQSAIPLADTSAAEQGSGLIQAPEAVTLAEALAQNAAGTRTLSWTGAGGTSFTAAANWNDVTNDLDPALSAPGETDTAEFLTGGGLVGGTGTAAALDFGGLAQWVLGASSTLTAAGTAGVTVGAGGSGVLLLTSGATIISQGSTDIISGASGQAAGVTVNGIGSIWGSDGELVVGGTGLGGLAIQAGGTVTAGAGLTIADGTSSDGSSMDLSGAGSKLRVTGLLDVGVDGSGGLSISDGASVTADTLDAGNFASAVANISVSDADFTVTGSATVADDGTGVMSVLSGATFSAGNLTIGSQGDSSGALVVSGDNSVVNVSGELNIGTALGTGDLTIGPGATVNASVVNLQGEVVLENGELDPAVDILNPGFPSGGSGGLGGVDSNGLGYVINETTIYSQNPPKSAATTLTVAGTIVGGGSWTENGTVEAAASNGVGIMQVGTNTTMILVGPVLDVASVTFQDDQPIPDSFTVNNSVTDMEFVGASGVLRLADIDGFGGTITAFQAGDEILFDTSIAAQIAYTTGNSFVSVVQSGDTVNLLGTLAFASSALANTAASTANFLVDQVSCFAAGTRLGTVAVEDLAVGISCLWRRGDSHPSSGLGRGRWSAGGTRGRRVCGRSALPPARSDPACQCATCSCRRIMPCS